MVESSRSGYCKMRAREYLKNSGNKSGFVACCSRSLPVISEYIAVNRKVIFSVAMCILLAVSYMIVKPQRNIIEIADADGAMVEFMNAAGLGSSKTSVITIPTGMVKANPFVPYRDFDAKSKVDDVPVYSLVEPPEFVNESSDAARVMDTIVSGILYDKYSPSAILNIEGTDYLVKKGDVVNNYKVINIMRDSVTVKLGANVYKAGIGEILTEGVINKNDVSNLNHKFGGKK